MRRRRILRDRERRDDSRGEIRGLRVKMQDASFVRNTFSIVWVAPVDIRYMYDITSMIQRTLRCYIDPSEEIVYALSSDASRVPKCLSSEFQ